MSSNNHEIVYEGWLTKSPPLKRIWKARWRRRWFVLRHSGELPGQFFLQYYTDRNCRKLKGTIDLDECEQVDAGLRFKNSKQDYPHMFDVKTPKRTYYLAAESETDMNKWVDCVCQVCGLKAAHDDTSVEFTEENNDSLLSPSENADTESPPVSPASTVSGPYIPISECITGKPLNTPIGISDFNNIISRQGLSGIENGNRLTSKDSYQVQPLRQNKLNNIKQTICADDISKSDNKSVTLVMTSSCVNKSSVDRLNSLYGDKNILTNVKSKNDEVVNSTKITNIESAKKMAELKTQSRRPPNLKLTEPISDDFYDSPRKIVVDVSPTDGRQPGVPIPNWDTFPNADASEETDFSPGDIGSWSIVQRFGKLQVVDSKQPCATNSLNRNTKHKIQPDTLSLRRPVAPPRPPKPHHLILQDNARHYLNLNSKPNGEENPEKSPPHANSPQPQPTPTIVSDEMYDFPRSHQPQNEEPPATGNTTGTMSRHNYSNAAPGQVTGNIFRYDFTDSNNVNGNRSSLGEPTSPRSEGCGSGAIYSNLPSPLTTGPGVPTPPAVNRELKPTRKMSDSGASNEPSPGGPFTPSFSKEPSPGGPFSIGSAEPSPGGPPSIDRTLKPKKHQTEALKLGRPPESSLSLRRLRAAPSPVLHQGSSTLPSNVRNNRTKSENSNQDDESRRSPDNETIYFYEANNRFVPSHKDDKKKFSEIEYLDLDLDSDVKTPTGGCTQPAVPSTTVYKTVDFLKTEAFNRTRQEVEEERNKLPAE